MLSKEQIENNKQEFINLIKSITREFDKDKLIDWLENKSDFFTAPASTKYHRSYEGGLCDHSLNVYYALRNLNCSYMPELAVTEEEAKQGIHKYEYDEDTLKIVGLLHDISKANYYEVFTRNVKDNDGNWKQNTEFMVSTFIPLTIDEKVALLHKSGGKAFDSTQENIPTIFNKYKLAALLHCADMLSCYILENPDEERKS
jgi:hypothetical protein